MKIIDNFKAASSTFIKCHIEKNDNISLILFIILACWLLNYLSIQGYGLYHDDLPAIADFTKLKLFNGVNSPFEWLTIWPHGRPLGWFFLSLLGWPGRASGELIYLYLTGFIIISTISVLIYLIVKNRFGRVAGLLTAFMYLASPVETTRIELTLNYIAHTGLFFCIFAIWLYQKNRIYTSYAVAALALLCYESTFFPFVAAPLLTLNLRSLSSWKKQILHGLICVVIVLSVSAVRYWVFDSKFTIHPGQQDKDFLITFFLGIKEYSLHFFNFFAFGIKQGLTNITALSIGLGIAVCLPMIYIVYKSKSYAEDYKLKNITDIFVIGFILLMLGLITSGFADYYPIRAYGGRNTRVYLAATFGGGLIITSFVFLALHLGNKHKITVASFILIFILLFGITSNALKIQSDYVEAWHIQKQVFRSAIDLSCDAIPGDKILLTPQDPPWDKGRAIYPYGFGYSTTIADIFDWGDINYRKIPSLMKANKEWHKQLELRKDGRLHWKKQMLSGFPVLAILPLTQQSIIHLKGTKRGLIRDNTPIFVDGVNIIKPEPAGNTASCIFREKELTGPLAPFFYPDIFAFNQ